MTAPEPAFGDTGRDVVRFLAWHYGARAGITPHGCGGTSKGEIVAGIVKKGFGSADEVRTPNKTRMEVVDLGGVKAARMTLEPGWRWSECIKPIAGTESCQTHHVGTVVSGSMHVVHDDGTEQDVAAGDAYVIEPGHDAWVTSDEPMVGFEFDSSAAQSYAKPS